ncbi:tetratricopeptide repeat protein [Flavobacterium capsici]|uniref:Tetratricopeptide repeat protein n=1 Tax=Flavobacterium capsici TaxID=3075618 RepID=A0AA96F026_9FLAO|nr:MULTISPECIES: hypothetical protein [unclassified Flavobacterium]WNM20110.1 hypothetical protein RN608_05380 [Flavobacterium sp. PMR2A8]WNM21500.1 hypothetical protein RN605_12550 [Flavobacterium sp. PMTSA4]
MKKLIFLFIISNFGFAQNTIVSYTQDYFLGNNLNCPSENNEAREMVKNGIELLHLNRDLNPKYLWPTVDLFAKAVMKDQSFCDAYFFAGYTLNLLKQYRETYAFYRVADSLSPKPFLLYKLNTAALCLKIGRVEESRKFFNDITKHFPESPEGYYGVALTAPMIGDYSNGYKNIEDAITIYKGQSKKIGKEVFFLRAVLLTLDKQYENALIAFEDVRSPFTKDINYNIHYSLALLKVSELKNDPKMKKEALKYYKKIENPKDIPDDVRALFKF